MEIERIQQNQTDEPEHVWQEGRRLLFYARGVFDAWYEARLRPLPELSELDSFLLLDMPPLGDSTE